MKSTIDQEWAAALNEVEKDDQGRPLMLSRWGWIIEVVGGKKVMVAATPEQFFNARASELGRPLTDEEKTSASVCLGGAPSCYAGECTGSCTRIYNAGLWYCMCA